MQKIDIDQIKQAVLDSIYPVGSVYINATVATNPASLLGFGTWAAHGIGRVMVGVDGTQVEFDTLGETGGAKTINTSHQHTENVGFDGGSFYGYGDSGQNPFFGSTVVQAPVREITAVQSNVANQNVRVGYTQAAGDTAQNNLPPYTTVYMWKRTA